MRQFNNALLICALLVLAACESSGVSDTTPEGLWEKGTNLVDKGEKLQEKSAKTIAKNEKAIRDAEADTVDANIQIDKQRSAYQAFFISAGNAKNFDQVEYEARELDRIKDRWEDALSTLKKSKKKVASAEKSIKKAEAQSIEATTMIRDGKHLLEQSRLKQW